MGLALKSELPAAETTPPTRTPHTSQSSEIRPSGQEPSGGHQALLQRAIVTLESRRSISARAWQRVDLFGKQLEGSGTYLEQRSEEGIQLRLELKFPVDDDLCIVLQVCSGRYLWRYEKFRDAARLARIDTARVVQALQEKGDPPTPGRIGDWPGWGGVPKLLRGMNAAFEFTRAEPANLTGGFPAIRLEGIWRQERLLAMLPEHEEAIKQGRGGGLEKLPPQVPHYVVLYLGRDDLFPYRTEYHRRGPSSGEDSPPGDDTMIAVMELREVVYNSPIPRDRFHYDPGTLEYSEQTDRFLETLGLMK